MSAPENGRGNDRGFEPTLGVLCELLGTDEDCPPDKLLHRARTAAYTLSPLLLSAAAHEGRRMGSGSEDELRRHRARLAVYAEIAAAVAPHGARVVKGPGLSRFQPDWVVRTSGDLDLLAADEVALWRSARIVADILPVYDLMLTVTGWGAGGHFMVGLFAPSEDPWLDPELRVEIATYAYPGDCEAVPLRSAMPARESVAQLLAVAEERFQRGFTVRDVLDCAAVLASSEAPDPAELAEAAAEANISPELLELIDFARGFPSVAPVIAAAYGSALAEPAEAERERRTGLCPAVAEGSSPDGETVLERVQRKLVAGGSVAERLRTAFPVFGMPLRVDGPFWPRDRAAVHASGDFIVLTSPLGAFLLVAQEWVDPVQYRRAQEFARELAQAQAQTATAAESAAPPSGS